jgi:hypothetical protein
MAMARWTDDAMLPPVGDEAMRAGLAESRPYSVVLLQDGERADHPDRDRLLWEHGRRNFRLRAAGHLAVVLPIRDETDVHGVAVFDLDVDTTRAVMDADPAVQAGVFAFEVHAARGFPGDRLPVPAEGGATAEPGPRPIEQQHRDGSLWYRGFVLDGEQHGDWEWFRTDGSRMRSGSFDRGTQVGVWTTYDRAGAAVKRTRFPGAAGSATDHTTDDQWAGDV